jgi:peptidoglycan/LPS O-acetylase OafA/YrhL
MSASLAEYDGNRHNNFTSIRIMLAWSVLYGHSFAIQPNGIRDPLTQLFQGSTWIGELAVNGFFIISGFLVAASLVQRGFIDYCLSRALRIYPALALCVFMTVFILGPIFTTQTLSSYFSDGSTFLYLKNALAFSPMQWSLPGVFEGNPRNAVNGSLWTLTVEVRCYSLLALLGLIGVFRQRAVVNVLAVALVLFGFYFFSDFPLLGRNEKWARLAFHFLLGVALYANRDKIELNYKAALFFLLLGGYALGREWFNYVFPLCLAYLLFFFAYRTPYLNVDGRLGDISYGVYIYAWPVQQSVAQLFPEQVPYFNTLVSTPVVVLLAYGSWHLLEKPCLGLKSKILTRGA